MISSLNDIAPVAKYLRRIGAKPRSLLTAVVQEQRGDYFKEIAVIHFTKTGEVECKSPDFLPTAAEAAEIAEAFKGVQFPEPQRVHKLIDLPDEVIQAKPEDVFRFYDENGMIIMLQLRKEIKGERSYQPYTYFTDGKWRKQEPGHQLPLWGIPNLKNASTIFIHEGAGAARYCDWMTKRETKSARDAYDAFPWADELSNAAHVGWIGGAMSPYRTDWSVINRCGDVRVFVVADNDKPGRDAVQDIAQAIKKPVFKVQFTSEFPVSFDLKDPFPKDLFKSRDGSNIYVGPPFSSFVHPATWATDAIPHPKGGRPTIVLRESFKDLWAYIDELDLWVCKDFPKLKRNTLNLNNMLSAFSHTNNTTSLVLKSISERTAKLCYKPDTKGRVVTTQGTSAINIFVPTDIKPHAGDPKPWLNFLEYLFPKEDERYQMMRWCATLIARTDIRMEYGVLLVSEHQGTGKSTLGKILAKLVGEDNVSTPEEGELINPDFNSWAYHKRFVLVNEIYAGHSWKAYHKLKTVITERTFRVNEKYEKPYDVENWCHIFACSNSVRALKMEQDDRRWFYPSVQEEAWKPSQFNEFYDWLVTGGYQIIMHWAINFGDYVMPGERAPMTEAKLVLINESLSDVEREVGELADKLISIQEPACLGMKEVEEWAKDLTRQAQIHESNLELRKAMKQKGALIVDGGRWFVGGRSQFVVCNKAFADAFKTIKEKDKMREFIGKCLKRSNDLLPVPM